MEDVSRFVDQVCRSKFGHEKCDQYKRLFYENDVDGEVSYSARPMSKSLPFRPSMPTVQHTAMPVIAADLDVIGILVRNTASAFCECRVSCHICAYFLTFPGRF